MPRLKTDAERQRPSAHTAGGSAHYAVTLARGLEILGCFTPEAPQLGNKQIAERTGLGKSTISRFSSTLCDLGYLALDRSTGRYHLGPAVLSLAYPLLATIRLRQVARGAMQRLADDVGGSVSIGVRDRYRIVYIETSRPAAVHSQELSDIGMSHPIARSAIGRAYLAACEPDAQTALINQISVDAPDQIADMARLRQHLREYRQRGFCASFGEVRSNIHAVGVPLRLRATGEVYAFNCVLPAFMLRRGQLVGEIGPRLVSLVQSLGFT